MPEETIIRLTGGFIVENKTLTDEIYAELVDGLKTGLDWTQFLAKHGASKGPLYNAIGRFFNDMEPKVRALNEVQAELDRAGLQLDSLDQRIKEAEGSLAPLEDRRDILNKEIKTLETRLAEKSELLEHARELGKLGFDIERLKQLQDALTEIGTKHGLKGKEAVRKFFAELKDYDAKTGFEREIQRLETITETKELEAENWQAKAERLESQYKNLKEAVDGMQALLRRGVKAKQIVSWNGIISKLGGPEELQDKLKQYRSISELLTAQRQEIKGCEEKVIELSAQVRALNEQKLEIKAAIKSLSSSGVKEIAKVSDKAMTVLETLSNRGEEKITKVRDKAVTGLESLSTRGLKEVTKVSEKAIAELKSLLDEIRVETDRLAHLKEEAGKFEKELIYAKCVTTSDEAVLKSLPKEVIIAFLGRALSYFNLNELNPIVSVPHNLPRYSYGDSSTVFLLDLLAWAEVSVVEALQTAERGAPPVTQQV